MLSKFLSDKVYIAKAWSDAVRHVCDSYILTSEILPYMVMVEIGSFSDVIVKDEFIAEIYAKDIAAMICKKGWEGLPAQEVAALVQMAFDCENEEVREKFHQSEVTLIQKRQDVGNLKRKSVKVPEFV